MKDSLCDFIVGVERDIIERFLILVKEKYPLVDKANYFLELNLGVSGINVAITNQRDILSHLCTIITDTSLNYQQKLDQISTAEEHLRRAIIESYERSTSLIIDNVRKLYEEYKEKVLPLTKRYPILSSAPNTVSIGSIFEKIEKNRAEGRAAKARNKWDDLWEKGVDSFLEAFNQLKELEKTIEDYLIRAKQINIEQQLIESERRQRKLTRWGIIATVICFILGVILTIILLRLSPSV